MGRTRELRWTLAAGAGVCLLAALLLLPGLGARGLWSEGELTILDRTLAALGEPRSELERSPWLPDALRTWCYAKFGRSDVGLRLPGALASLGLVTLTFVCARRLGWALRWSALAGVVALGLPLLLVGGRTALGNPTGEFWMTGSVLATVTALNVDARVETPLAARVGLGLVGLACLAASVASLGLMLGGCLPLTLIAFAELGPRSHEPDSPAVTYPAVARYVAWTAAAVAGFLALRLAFHQGDGYIPLLGAARDLELVEDPTKRGFADSLEEFGYLAFPITGLVAAGLLSPGRARWPAIWLGVAVLFVSVWSLVYGPTAPPVVLPTALLATAALERMLDPREPIANRRLILALAVLGALILGKDAGRTPAVVASPLLEIGKLDFPNPFPGGEHLDFGERLSTLAKAFAAALLFAHALAPPSEDQVRARARLARQPLWARAWERVDSPTVETVREHAPLALVAVTVVGLAFSYGRGILDDMSEQMSIASPLRNWQVGVDDGSYPSDQLGLHRIRDEGLRHYGPGPSREVFLSSRSDVDVWLSDAAPRVALLRRRDLPPAFATARTRGQPLHVLDAHHHEYVLVANFLPAGREDLNPLADIVLDAPPELANETLVRWEPYVDLIAWELDGPLHRGGKVTLRMVFRVHRPLPAGTKLYARLQKGKTSRVGALPRPLTRDVMPPNFWRAGDYVLHEEELEVPWLEVRPGEHDLIVGLRRSEKTNLKITTPEGGTGEFGVTIKGKRHEFAVIGQADLAW